MIPGSGRSPGKGNGNPIQYSCLENHTDNGAWRQPSMGSQRVEHDLAMNNRSSPELKISGSQTSTKKPKTYEGSFIMLM